MEVEPRLDTAKQQEDEGVLEKEAESEVRWVEWEKK